MDLDENTIDITYLDNVMGRTSCLSHTADINEPCWWVFQTRGGRSRAVCNTRAKKAGYFAQPSRSALQIGGLR